MPERFTITRLEIFRTTKPKRPRTVKVAGCSAPLYVRHTRGNDVPFVIKTTLAGKPFEWRFGEYTGDRDGMSLKQAKAFALNATEDIRKGIDPRLTPKKYRERPGLRLSELAELYAEYTDKRQRANNEVFAEGLHRHDADAQRARRFCALLGGETRWVRNIDEDDVEAAFVEIAEQSGPGQAVRSLKAFRAAFSRAQKMRRLDRSLICPGRFVGSEEREQMAKNTYNRKVRQRFKRSELRAFWQAVEGLVLQPRLNAAKVAQVLQEHQRPMTTDEIVAALDWPRRRAWAATQDARKRGYIDYGDDDAFVSVAPWRPKERHVQFYILASLLLLTGARRTEIQALRWQDVDLVDDEIYFAAPKNGLARTVALSHELLQPVRTALMFYAQERQPEPTERIFSDPGDRHTPWGLNAFARPFAELCAQAGIKRRAPKTLRAAFATLMHQHGATIDEIRHAIGHQPGSRATRNYVIVAQLGNASYQNLHNDAFVANVLGDESTPDNVIQLFEPAEGVA